MFLPPGDRGVNFNSCSSSRNTSYSCLVVTIHKNVALIPLDLLGVRVWHSVDSIWPFIWNFWWKRELSQKNQVWNRKQTAFIVYKVKVLTTRLETIEIETWKKAYGRVKTQVVFGQHVGALNRLQLLPIFNLLLSLLLEPPLEVWTACSRRWGFFIVAKWSFGLLEREEKGCGWKKLAAVVQNSSLSSPHCSKAAKLGLTSSLLKAFLDFL